MHKEDTTGKPKGFVVCRRTFLEKKKKSFTAKTASANISGNYRNKMRWNEIKQYSLEVYLVWRRSFLLLVFLLDHNCLIWNSHHQNKNKRLNIKDTFWELQKQKRLNLKHFFVVSTVKVFAIVLQLMSDPCDVTQSDVSAESLKHSRNTSLKKK